jgi:hypothetical protein
MRPSNNALQSDEAGASDGASELSASVGQTMEMRDDVGKHDCFSQ